ncbi:PAS domain S-box protein [Planktothrix sp. FACHB-1365]|uniref:PAS domain S-box protein n=1 Tax=Planktothrix sp. FACHB-1365 TaxID=2692855 RepID=UPI00168942C4|nr:PAS domain S-box protein [Planktothrix sp. FACHB-1365]MBD2484542.1 PAS domain S-box protein [Planktothrix sp. FACHB-1365]
MELNGLPSYIPTLNQLLDKAPLSVSPEMPVLEVLRQMNDNPYYPASYVVVQQQNQLVGIFTERDVIHLISSSQPLAEIKMQQVMTTEVVILKQAEYRDIYHTISLLREHQIRHLPVVDDQGQLQGVITGETLRQMLQPINLLRLRSVAEVMTTPVIQAFPSTPVLDVAKLLAQHQISCLVVVEERPPQFPINSSPITIPVGLITERDLLRFQSQNQDISGLTALEMMNQPLLTIHQHDNLWRANQQMQKHRVRRLVVTGNQGELLGIITQSNLLRLFDPAELNEIVTFLQQKVQGLEVQKQQLLDEQEQIIEQRVQQRLRELQHPPETEKQTEVELQKAHQQLTFHVENSPLAVIEWDEQFRLKRWSPQAEKIFGWKAEEILHRHWNQWEFVYPEDLEQVNALASQLLNGEESRNICCNRNYTKDGTLVYCEWYNSVLKNESGQVISLLSLVQDVSVRQTAQGELKRRARQQQVIAELGQYALCQTNLDTLLQKVVILVGQTLGIKYVQIWELLANESTFLLTAGLGWRSGSVGRITVGQGRKSQPGYTLLLKEPIIVEDLRVESRFSGCAFFYNHNIVSGVTVLISGKEKPFGVLGIHTEEERRFTSDEINFLQAIANIIASCVERQQAEEELNRFFNLSLDIFCIATTQGFFKRVNPRMLSLLGYTETELLGQSFLGLIHPDDWANTLLELENLSLGIPSHNFENRYQCKNGSYRWLSWTAMPFDETQYYAVARDVSENKRTEAALRKSEKRYATLAEVSPVGIFHCDIEGNCLYVNQRWCEIAGLTPEEALGQGWTQAIHPEDQAHVKEEWQRLRTDSGQIRETSLQKIQFCCEYRLQRQDGQMTWVYGQAVEELNDQGEIIGYVGTITDISGRKQAEAELKTLNEELEVRVADRTTELSFMNEKLHRQVVELQEIESQLEDKAYQQAIIAELGQKALSEMNLVSLINEIVVQIAKDLNVEYCKVLEYNLEGGFLTLAVWDEPTQHYTLLSHEPLIFNPPIIHQFPDFQDELKFNVSQQQLDLEENDLNHDNFTLLNQGICIPIMGQNYHDLGRVEIYGKKLQLFSEDDVNFLQSVANILATAIERKQAEEVIRQSEQLYRLMADHSTDLISRHTPQGVYLYASPASRSLLGYEPEELVGRSAYELFHPEDLAKINRPHQSSIETADINTIVYRILRKDQDYVWFETTQKKVRDQTGNIQEIVAISRDITDRKQTEEALRFSEERFKITLKNSPIVVFNQDLELRYTWIYNPAGGYAPEAVIGRLDSDIFPPENAVKLIQLKQQVLNTKVGLREEVITNLHNQDIQCYDLTIDPLLDLEGNIIGITGAALDITDRKKAELELQESQRFIQRITDASPNILYIYDLMEKHTIYVNHEITKVLGYTREAILEMGSTVLPDLVHSEDYAQLEIYHQKLATATEDEIFEFEYRMKDIQGNWHWLVSRDTIFARTSDGKPKHILGAATDITERKRVEEKLRLSERAIAYSSNGIVIADARQQDYPIVFVNPAFEKVTGYSAQEAIGKNSRFLQGKDRRQSELKQIKKALEQKKNCNVVLKNYRKDGSLFWNELNISPIYDEAGNLTHYLEIQNDITESKLAEERLGQQVIRERLIATITQRIRESLDLKSILSTMVTEVKQFLKADRVLVYRIYPDSTGTVIAEDVNPEWSSILEQTFSEEIFPSECYPSYINGKIASIANIKENKILPCLVKFLEQFQVQAKLAVPIIENETLWGLLITHQCSQPRQWEEWEISLLQQITSQLAIAIQQSELYEQLQTELKERSLAQQALLVSQERLQYLLSSSPGIIYSSKAKGDYEATFISDNIKTLLGYNVSEFTQPGFWLNHIHPEDINKLINQDLSVLFEQGYASYEYRFKHQDGTYHWMYDQAKLIRDGEGNALEIVGYWIDISDRKQAEERLKATNEQLQAVLDAVPGFVSWISSDLHYLGVNRHLANTYQLQPEDFVGQEIGFIQGSHEFAQFMEQFMCEPYLKTSEVTLETRIQDATRYYLLVAQKYDQDQAAIFIGIDITERKRIEEQLWATTSRLSTLIENLQLGVLVKDECYKIVLTNQAFCNLFKIHESPEKLIGMDGSTFAFEYQNIFSDPAQFIIRNQEVMRRKRVVVNEELSLVDGRTLERDYVPIMIQGASQGHLWMYRDITERKKAEDTLVTSLREKEVLLKEIHHRVKNNLLVVSNLLEFQSDYVQQPELIKVLEDSRNRIYSMALIHEKLYRSTNLEKISFGDYLEDLIDNLFESYNIQDSRVQFELDIEPVGLNIETAQPCGLIVNELVSNTLKHAFPNGRAGIVYLGLHQNEEDKISVTVRDNGIGFPEGVDFRNVESLGMELVCTLTDQLEGTITLDRENGTQFTVSFSELQYRHRL